MACTGAMDGTWIDRMLLPRRNPRTSDASDIQFLQLPGGVVRARVLGSGAETVVFVCDTPVFIEHYHHLFTMLAPRMRVVCFELLGMGFSVPSGSFRFRLDEQAEITAQLLDAVGARGCTLAFTCVSAYLAPLLAARRPDLVRRVMLIQAPSWSEEDAWARRIDFDGKGILATPWLGPVVVRLGRRASSRRWFEKALGDVSPAAFIETANQAFAEGAGWALASMVQSYFRAPPPALAPLTVPTLALWGAKDRTHRRTNKGSVLEIAPNATIVTFDSAGHCPELECPEEFATVLDDFMKRSPVVSRNLSP